MGMKVVRFVCFANWGEDNESVLRSLAPVGDLRDSNWTKHQSLQDPFIGLGCVYAADNRRFTNYFGILVMSAFVMHYFKQRFPMIRGSGCPQLKGVLLNRLEMKPEVELPLKFGSVVLMNGLGLSVGSAGPAVQLGACFGQLILKGRKNCDFLHSCAMAAFAVLYGVPMAAIAFAIEEYQLKFKLEQL